MTYQETVEYLYNSTPVFEKIGVGAYKEGLGTSLALDQHLCHPHRHYPTIHVGGTNGKGSVSHTIASILQASGYKVGLYTSPHLVDFRERIKVDGECCSEDFVVSFVEQHRNFFEPLHPSFFELTTAMAFDYFAKSEVDVAVIEVGLGGRLDCTNIITPELSIITNISYDHTQLLGSTLAQIASEKAGIIKPGVPVVIGENDIETRPVFEQKAKEMHSPILFAEDSKEVDACFANESGGMTYLTRHDGIIEGDLGGEYQKKNTNTVLTAIRVLAKRFTKINGISICHGIGNVVSNTGLMGRWQRLRVCPTVVCDTGHNAGGWRYLSEQLKKQECRQMHIVFGMVDDKDISTVMDMLPRDATYYFTKASSKRAISESEVQHIGLSKGLIGSTYRTVKEAFSAAIKNACEEDFIFVGGSSYVVADFLAEYSE